MSNLREAATMPSAIPIMIALFPAVLNTLMINRVRFSIRSPVKYLNPDQFLAKNWSGFKYFTGLRIENLTLLIMSVFNTAGNRAIMIGIALGIVAASLKLLIGYDRSYLGKD